MARPQKFKESFHETALDLMKVGASIVEVCAEIDISRETLYDWINKDSPRYNEAFSDTIKKGTLKSQAWWEKQGRKALAKPVFQTGLWTQTMKCRFRKDWGDKEEEDKGQTPRTYTMTVAS